MGITDTENEENINLTLNDSFYTLLGMEKVITQSIHTTHRERQRRSYDGYISESKWMNDTFCGTQHSTSYLGPTCSKYNSVNSFLDQSNITDWNLRRIFRMEMLFCSNDVLCDHQRPYVGMYGSCCSKKKQCSCANDCKLGGNCCPGTAKSYDDLVAKNRKVLCRYPQLLRHNIREADVSFVMVDSCADVTTSALVRENCEKEWPDTELDPFLHIPVYSSNNNYSILYKNKYCALCNFHVEKDILYWKMNIKCDPDQNTFVYSGLQNLFSFVQKHARDCNIIFEKPIDIGREYPCERTNVETCPEMPGADQFHSRVCTLYTSVYENVFTSYKNIFCFLCNGGKLEEAAAVACTIVEPSNRIHSFSILIDFNSLNGPHEKQEEDDRESSKCTTTQKYDTHEVCYV